MGQIILKTKQTNVNGEERITTSRVSYSTISSDLICAATPISRPCSPEGESIHAPTPRHIHLPQVLPPPRG